MSFSRRVALLIAVLPTVLFAAGCADEGGGDTATDPAPLTLSVESQGWTGWQREQPEPELTSETITDGSTFEVAAISGPIEFTVVEIAGYGVELETDDSLVITDAEGDIDFDETTTHFTLDREEPLALATPTMDAGTHITLTVG